MLNVVFSMRRVKMCLLPLLLMACSSPPEMVLLIRADKVFDGHTFLSNKTIQIENGVIVDVLGNEEVAFTEDVIDLGDATVLPAFFDLHSHVIYQQVPQPILVRHGLAVVRDLGGPKGLESGDLTVVNSGLILTSEGGYPINLMGAKDIAIAIQSEEHARTVVRQQINDGASIIKIALEAGGELGAPWNNSHHRHHVETAANGELHPHTHKWPLLPLPVVKAIVDEAHQHGVGVTAHIGEEEGVRLALEAGVDEWAHIPCEAISPYLLAQAVTQGVVFVTTLDTLSRCHGIAENTRVLGSLGAKLLYGAEVAHPDIPWGIDAQELLLMQQWAGMQTEHVLQAATSKPAQYLGMEYRGVIKVGARADLIAVQGDIRQHLKSLEYPSLVINQGNIIVNHFAE